MRGSAGITTVPVVMRKLQKSFFVFVFRVSVLVFVFVFVSSVFGVFSVPVPVFSVFCAIPRTLDINNRGLKDKDLIIVINLNLYRVCGW